MSENYGVWFESVLSESLLSENDCVWFENVFPEVFLTAFSLSLTLESEI